jgi:hypothetical protein
MTQHGLTAGDKAALDRRQANNADYIEKTPARAAFSRAFVLAFFVDWQPRPSLFALWGWDGCGQTAQWGVVQRVLQDDTDKQTLDLTDWEGTK